MVLSIWIIFAIVVVAAIAAAVQAHTTRRGAVILAAYLFCYFLGCAEASVFLADTHAFRQTDGG